MANRLKKARTLFYLNLYSKGKGRQYVEVEEMPIERTVFLNTLSEWQKIEIPKNLDFSSCMFFAKKGEIFSSHLHTNKEQITITNKGGKFRYHSEKLGSGILEYPNSIVFEANDWHAVEWLEDTDVLITWSPAFKKGWAAKFKEDE